MQLSVSIKFRLFNKAVELDDEDSEDIQTWQAKADAAQKWHACEEILKQVEPLFEAADFDAASRLRKRNRLHRTQTKTELAIIL